MDDVTTRRGPFVHVFIQALNIAECAQQFTPSCFGQLVPAISEAVSSSFLPTRHHLTLPLHHPSPSLHLSVVSNMADHSQSSRFRGLFEHALQDYEKQTGTKLAGHPLAEQLQSCSSIDSVLAILQQQAQAFSEFRGSNGRIMKSLKSAVSAIHALSSSTTLSEVISMVRCRVLTGFSPL
jgi:hypothetical protein